MSEGERAARGGVDALGNNCFGCGAANASGLRLDFVVGGRAPHSVTATAPFLLSRDYEGGRGVIHGGIVATLLDEAMSKLNKPLGVRAVTRHMEVEYLRPSPVERKLAVTGRHVRREGRKLFHAAEIVDEDGRVLARGKGLFLVLEETDKPRG